MADNIFHRTFFQPVYKNPPSDGLAEAGDVIVILLNAADGTHPTQNLTIQAISEDGRTVYFEYDATNQYVRPGDIFAVHPDHQFECPEVGDLCYVAEDEVSSFTINGGTPIAGPWAVDADGADALQEAIDEAIVNNGAATVVLDDTTLRIYIMNTTVTFAATLASGSLVTCAEFDA